MASPMNPLDVFTTYTYHFELHAAKDWDTLKGVANSDVNASTTRYESNGTLLINTRKDAHQVIDDVRFTYNCPNQNPYGQFTPAGRLTMNITEPGGAFFIEKLHKKMDEEDVQFIGNLVFGLKIFFVGRTPGNSIVTIPMPNIIPIQFIDMSSKFSFKGGEYNLNFTLMVMGSASSGGFSDNNLGISYFNKSVSIKAKTVKEALSELQKKLNDSYNNDYEKNLDNAPGCRPIKYFINLDPSLDGKLSTIGADSYAPDDFIKLTFDPSQTILTWVNTVVRSSKEINDIVGASLPGINKEDHPGVKIVSVLPRYYPKDGVVEMHYDIGFYEGGGEDLYIFDFMFTDPGLNVDVMDFDIQMKSLQAWFADGSKYGVDENRSGSATMPQEDAKKMSTDIVHPDKSKQELYKPVQKRAIPGRSGDVAFLDSMPRTDNTGHIKFKHEAVASAKLAFSSLTEMHAAYNPQVAFTIRGHLDLLKRGIVFPDVTLFSGEAPIGTKKPTQVIVNINSPDESHQPFFYTGKYMLMTIDNVFSGGKFTQIIHVMMQEAE